jgi:hypothetical protein
MSTFGTFSNGLVKKNVNGLTGQGSGTSSIDSLLQNSGTAGGGNQSNPWVYSYGAKGIPGSSGYGLGQGLSMAGLTGNSLLDQPGWFNPATGARVAGGANPGLASGQLGGVASGFDSAGVTRGVLSGALVRDIGAYQEAADAQFDRNNGQIGAMQSLVSRAPGQILDAGNTAAGQLRDRAAQGDQLGRDQYAEFQDRAYGPNGILARYKDMSAQEASSASRGMAESYSQALSQITAAGGQAGLTNAERTQQRDTLQRDFTQNYQTAITGILSDFNKTFASLGTSIAGLGQQAMAGARQQFESGTQLTQAATQIENAATLQATDYEFRGRTAIADMVRQNPNSVVSWFSGLAALYNAQSGTGGSSGGGNFGNGQGGTKWTNTFGINLV